MEENRLWEEAEAKRRAEVARRIREAAEASAKRREEEDRLWEEALEKRRAEKEKRILEGADSLVLRREEEKERAKKEEERKQKAAEAKKRLKPAAKAKGKIEGNPKIRKRVLAVSMVVVLAVAGIWAFSVFKKDSETASTPLSETKETDISETNVIEKANTESLNKVSTLPNFVIGDIYNEGIIFEINDADNTVKIAHLEDAGPMSWQNASKIHEQLGEGWRLPTLEELSLMYQTIGQGADNVGEFTNGLYWSATTYEDYQARLLRFWDGNTSFHYNRYVEERQFKVRAIRDLKIRN